MRSVSSRRTGRETILLSGTKASGDSMPETAGFACGLNAVRGFRRRILRIVCMTIPRQAAGTERRSENHPGVFRLYSERQNAVCIACSRQKCRRRRILRALFDAEWKRSFRHSAREKGGSGIFQRDRNGIRSAWQSAFSIPCRDEISPGLCFFRACPGAFFIFRKAEAGNQPFRFFPYFLILFRRWCILIGYTG